MEVLILKKSLGKGLDSLIRSNDGSNSSNVNKNSELFITDLLPNSDQPRKKFDEESLKDLSESIKVHGLLQPITVKNNDDGKFTIIAGERRWRASQIAGIKKVPVNIINIDDKNLFELALVENVQREDLNPVEAAMAIKDLIEKYNFSNEQLIKVTGKKRASISNTLRILELPEKVLNWIIEGKVSRGHAVALLALDNQSEIIKFAEQIIKKNLSVRDIEKISRVRKIEKNLNMSDNRNIYLDNLKKEMETQTGLTIKVKGSTNKGKVEIRYDSLEELNNLIKFFKKNA
jgi:ParB family chromosome partitioning protein|tara:strand:- start:25395 stop:26261 length:867 start_codon:yes stop_codon:yes gene_type:complete